MVVTKTEYFDRSATNDLSSAGNSGTDDRNDSASRNKNDELKDSSSSHETSDRIDCSKDDQARDFEAGDLNDNARLCETIDRYDSARLCVTGDLDDSARKYESRDLNDNARHCENDDLDDSSGKNESRDLNDSARLCETGDNKNSARLCESIDSARVYNDSSRLYENVDINDSASNDEVGNNNEIVIRYKHSELYDSARNNEIYNITDSAGVIKDNAYTYVTSDVSYSASSTSTSNTSTRTYVSKGGVQCCLTESLPPSSESDEIEESVNNLIEQLRAVKLDTTALKMTVSDCGLAHAQSTGASYPNLLSLELFRQNQHLIDSLSNMAKQRGGNVFLSGSLLRDLGQKDDYIPKHVVCDMFILSPIQPFIFITISSGESTSLLRYNVTVARHLRRKVESANMTFDFVNGVIPLSSLHDGEFEECVRTLESDTNKIAFPKSLLMNNQKYEHVVAAIVPTQAIKLDVPLGCEAAASGPNVQTVIPESNTLLKAKLCQNEESNRRLKEENKHKTLEMDWLRNRVEELLSEIQYLESTLFRERNIYRFLADTETYNAEGANSPSPSRDKQSRTPSSDSEERMSAITTDTYESRSSQGLRKFIPIAKKLLVLSNLFDQGLASLDTTFADKVIDKLKEILNRLSVNQGKNYINTLQSLALSNNFEMLVDIGEYGHDSNTIRHERMIILIKKVLNKYSLKENDFEVTGRFCMEEYDETLDQIAPKQQRAGTNSSIRNRNEDDENVSLSIGNIKPTIGGKTGEVKETETHNNRILVNQEGVQTSKSADQPPDDFPSYVVYDYSSWTERPELGDKMLKNTKRQAM